jgi:CheY-like chemotaxis protein
MDKTTQERVFEPFYTTKPKGKGTGLGMSMVYGFVKRFGGFIKIYSEVDVGTTMRLYLPRCTETNEDVVNEQEIESSLSRGEETILVVDDEIDLLHLAENYLLDLGYRVVVAENAAQALDILKENKKIDMLFSDVVMPGGMNGYELAQKAVEHMPDLKVLLTSGFTSKPIAHNGLAKFSANLLNKPYRKTDLAKRLRQVLDGK